MSKTPLVCIVGHSSSGKTTYIERLIPELKKRGYCLALIKHHRHEFDIDVEGKDSWRYLKAGSDAAMVSSPDKVALIKKVDHDLSPDELRTFIGGGFDLIIIEGFKKADELKIEVHRAELGKALSCLPEDLVAVVTDENLDLPVAQYDLTDVVAIADLIEQRLLGKP
jgi:molybdopterin-guanine dinucleotide biosynthesis protein MobB